MRKAIILSVALLIASTIVHAQYLVESAEGKGTILMPMNGVGVGFDIGKSEITVGINNYKKLLDSSNNKFRNKYFLGLNLAVKNSKGTGDLFNSGDIVPSGNFIGFAGYSFDNFKHLSEQTSEIIDDVNIELTAKAAAREQYRADLKNDIKVIGKNEIDDRVTRKEVVDELSKQLTDAVDARAINRAIEDYEISAHESGQQLSAEEQNQFESFKEKLIKSKNERIKDYKKTYEKSAEKKAADEALRNFAKKHIPVRVTPFVLGGIYARDFTIFNGVDSSNFSNSFTDTLAHGGSIGIGLNVQAARWWLGATYSYIDGDNFISLNSKDYTIRTLDTNGNKSLQSEKKKTAYGGTYGKVATNLLNVDLIKEFALNDSSHLLATVYYRGSFSRDTSLLKSYSNLGVGVYFTGKKGKFLGGLYIELPDINNELEKAKPLEERNIRPPFKKLTFGVVTKISLSSILGFINKPRTPDE